jgi:hypothetical protein
MVLLHIGTVVSLLRSVVEKAVKIVVLVVVFLFPFGF